jgi:hypothetical protein
MILASCRKLLFQERPMPCAAAAGSKLTTAIVAGGLGRGLLLELELESKDQAPQRELEQPVRIVGDRGSLNGGKARIAVGR